MTILGHLIKSAISLKQQIGKGNQNPVEDQQNQLKELLEKAAQTEFGKHYSFSKILDSQDLASAFRENVPLHDYEKIHDEWWYRIEKNEDDITWPGSVDFFARTSGTTGSKSKRIAVTQDMVESIRKVGIEQVTGLSNYDLPAEMFEKDILMLGSSTDLTETENWKEGEISGISAGNIPFWFEPYYKPGKEIAAIEDWDQRVKEIARKAPEWDVGAVSGIPAWILLMLKEIMKEHDLESIHEIWPNLALFASGGVAFEPYREEFDAITTKPLAVLDTYLASEGFFAYQNRPETKSMKLATDAGIYFEFIPFDKRGFDELGNLKEDPKIFGLADVEEGVDYALVVSTCAGTWRYLVGDTIRFSDAQRFEIDITGRTKFFMNVAGSQLSVEKTDEAIAELEEKLEIDVTEYVLAAVKNGDGTFTHHWVLGLEGDLSEAEGADRVLDKILKTKNNNYKVARTKALTQVKVDVVPVSKIYDWAGAKKKKGGQVKIPKMMKEDQFEEFLELVLK
jgi:hypothetical protein